MWQEPPRTSAPLVKTSQKLLFEDRLRGAYDSQALPGFNVLLFSSDRNKMNSFVSGDTAVFVSLPLNAQLGGSRMRNEGNCRKSLLRHYLESNIWGCFHRISHVLKANYIGERIRMLKCRAKYRITSLFLFSVAVAMHKCQNICSSPATHRRIRTLCSP